jgi:hypothetical protein
MNKWINASLIVLISSEAFAFKCYITAMKDSCWNNYQVTIKIMDTVKKKELTEDVVLDKGTSWKRVSFDCQAKQSLFYSATFKPSIWRGTGDKVYYSKRYWYLPKEIKKDELAWNIDLCFPRAFSQVPLPPTADSKCNCDFKSTPPIKLKKKS